VELDDGLARIITIAAPVRGALALDEDAERMGTVVRGCGRCRHHEEARDRDEDDECRPSHQPRSGAA
jgi:hypothetical protein